MSDNPKEQAMSKKDEFRDEPPVDKEGNTPLDLAAEEDDWGVPDGERRYLLPAEPFPLTTGSHSNFEEGACFNELASVLAGEPFSDSPACVSPIIGRFGMRLNDRLDNELRQFLRPFVLRSLGTANDSHEEERRQMCNGWLLHYALPDLLDKADCAEAAQRLRALPADLAGEGMARAIREARDEAWKARCTAMSKLDGRIRAEPEGRGFDADDVAAAVAAVAVVDVAAAVVDVDVDVVVDADVVDLAAAVAVVDVVDVVVAVVAVVGFVPSKIRSVVYDAVYMRARQLFICTREELLTSALDLFDRMLPPEALMEPVVDIESARIICAAPQAPA